MSDSSDDSDGFDELPSELQKLAIEQHYIYVRAKAKRFVEVGPAAYRKSDPFGRPASTTPKALLKKLRLGCEQLVAWQGLTESSPLEGLGIEGFHALAALLHLRLVSQTARILDDDRILDRMVLAHEMTGDTTLIWNLVEPPGFRRRRNVQLKISNRGDIGALPFDFNEWKARILGEPTIPESNTKADVDVDALAAEIDSAVTLAFEEQFGKGAVTRVYGAEDNSSQVHSDDLPHLVNNQQRASRLKVGSDEVESAIKSAVRTAFEQTFGKEFMAHEDFDGEK